MEEVKIPVENIEVLRELTAQVKISNDIAKKDLDRKRITADGHVWYTFAMALIQRENISIIDVPVHADKLLKEYNQRFGGDE